MGDEHGFALTKDSGIIAIPLINPRPNIPFQTTGIITQASIRARFSTKRAAERTKVDGHVCERPCDNVATAHPSRELNVASRHALRGSDDRAVVWDVLPVTTQAVWVTVEDGRVLRGFHIFWPVPVLPQFRQLKHTRMVERKDWEKE